MFDSVREDLQATLDEIRSAGLHKPERVIGTPQSAKVAVTAGGRPGEVLNFCANNYLGLADHPEVVAAAHEALDRWGYGMASVRFICGTQEVHKELEARLSAFLGQEDTILYSSCFDANGGVFETLLGPEDAVISDALNHASIIDGIRLSKARRFRYANRDLADLEKQLKEATEGGARRKLIVTDGVFSMDGYVAPLREICDLADRYDAMVMVDDSHAVGFVGPGGRGPPEPHRGLGRVSTLTAALRTAPGAPPRPGTGPHRPRRPPPHGAPPILLPPASHPHPAGHAGSLPAAAHHPHTPGHRAQHHTTHIFPSPTHISRSPPHPPPPPPHPPPPPPPPPPHPPPPPPPPSPAPASPS
ncbi:aminotransferase class I/II-fold pyridoxal phosphate-dependent enzyme, partial [Streptomyces alfalfae]